MKKSLTVLWVLLFAHAMLYAQDTIVFKNGTKVFAHVREINPDLVRYQKADNPSGPLYTVARAEVDSIVYTNGTRDVFDANPAARPPDQAASAGVFTDSRDGKTYRMVSIGTQTWMAENLNYDVTGSWCIQCETYGRVYTWSMANAGCPAGWHLPSIAEWEILITNAGGGYVAGGNLKEAGQAYWMRPNAGATNSTGFTAIPHGYRSINGLMNFTNRMGLWWSSDADRLPMNALSFKLESNTNQAITTASDKNVGISVRCVKD